MKKLISKLTLSLVLILSFGMTAEAQLAKSGKFSGKFAVDGKVLAMHMQGKARLRPLYLQNILVAQQMMPVVEFSI